MCCAPLAQHGEMVGAEPGLPVSEGEWQGDPCTAPVAQASTRPAHSRTATGTMPRNSAWLGWTGMWLFGAVVGAAVCFAAVRGLPPPATPPAPPVDAVAEARRLLAEQKYEQVLSTLGPDKANTDEGRALRGEAQWRRYLASVDQNPNPDATEVQAAIADLQVVASKDCSACLLLGQIHEEFQQWDSAQATYDRALANEAWSPEVRAQFETALKRVKAMNRKANLKREPSDGRGDVRMDVPRFLALLAVLQIDGNGEQSNLAQQFELAVERAIEHKFDGPDGAIELLKKAKDSLVTARRKNSKAWEQVVGRNGVFVLDRCLDDLAAYWALLHQIESERKENLPRYDDPALGDKVVAVLNDARLLEEAMKKVAEKLDVKEPKRDARTAMVVKRINDLKNPQEPKLLADLREALVAAGYPKATTDPVAELKKLVQHRKDATDIVTAVARKLGAEPEESKLFEAIDRLGKEPKPKTAREILTAGRKLIATGQFTEALEVLRRRPEGDVEKVDETALHVALADAVWHHYLQTTASQTGSPDRSAKAVLEAVALLDRAVATGHADARYLLGFIEEATGNTEKAREHYNRGLKDHPEQERLFQTALRRLNNRPPSPPIGRTGP